MPAPQINTAEILQQRQDDISLTHPSPKPAPALSGVTDLGGRTLTLSDPLTVTSHLQLSNGSLHLKGGSGITVAAPGSLHLHNLKVVCTGPPPPGGARVHVSGAGASAQIQDCSISQSGHDSTTTSLVKVDEGASADLEACKLHGNGTGDGLHCTEPGSTVTAANCQASGCNTGFTCDAGATLLARGCQAASNKGHGFLLTGPGAITATACTASDNGGHGFSATSASAMMQLGPGCVSRGNKGAGYEASEGACLVAAQGCAAEKNEGSGFSSVGRTTQLLVGSNCTSTHNTGHGFHAADGGHLRVLTTGVASHNAADGYNAEGPSSHLFVGAKSTAEGNTYGFRASHAGRIEFGGEVEASSNKQMDYACHCAGVLA